MTEKTDTLNHFELGYVKTGVKNNIFRKKITFSPVLIWASWRGLTVNAFTTKTKIDIDDKDMLKFLSIVFNQVKFKKMQIL
jgi:hypothetical protein